MTNLAHILTESARRYPDRPAFRVDDVVVTYAELDALTARAAARLRARGVLPGDRVAILLGNGVVPERYAVAADLYPLEQIRKGMELRREEIMRSAQEVTSHQDFINRYCKAP